MTHPSLLLVEDDAITRRLLSAILTHGGYAVREATNGLEAVEMVRHNRPCLVLMDLDLPMMSGQEACRVLRADPQTDSLPILAVTTRDYRRELDTLRATGFSGYLQKPFSLPDVHRAVACCLEAVAKGLHWCDVPPPAQWNAYGSP